MSRADFKPVPCKQGCGKDVVWERDANGKWLPPFEFDVENWVKLERHNCPNYKPKPKPSFENRGQGTNWQQGTQSPGWLSTNKQGQFVEARESNARQQEATELQLILKNQRDMMQLLAQVLFILKKPEIALTDEEIKKIADTEKIDQEPSLKTADKEDDYGF